MDRNLDRNLDRSLPDHNSQPDYPTVDRVLGAIAGWINHYREQAGLRDAFGQCDPAEVRQIASDLNIPEAELRVLATKGPGSADNLQKLLRALNVDPIALARTDPAVMRDLQRLCVNCGHKQECSHELDVGSAVAHFHEFCPNSYTLDALFKPADKPAPRLADHLRG